MVRSVDLYIRAGNRETPRLTLSGVAVPPITAIGEKASLFYSCIETFDPQTGEGSELLADGVERFEGGGFPVDGEIGLHFVPHHWGRRMSLEMPNPNEGRR